MGCFVQPPEDGEMNEMTVPCRHMTRNFTLGGMRLSARNFSATEAPHNIECLQVNREKTFFFFLNLNDRAGIEPTSQSGSFNHCTKAPPPPGIG